MSYDVSPAELFDELKKANFRAVEAEAKLEAIAALAENWRYKGEFGWGPWQLGEGPDQEGLILDDAAADLRKILRGES